MCAQWSGVWTTTTGTLGDAQASYSQTDDAVLKRVTAACWGYQGVAPGYLNELKCTYTGVNTVAVNTGAAMVDGKVFSNSASVNMTIPNGGAGSHRHDRIVIRATWAGTDAALTVITGTAAAAPAITETSGTTYDILLCQVEVSDAGVCIVTDERDFASPPELALAVLGNTSSGAVATWGAIAAAAEHTVLQRHGDSLGFGVVTDEMIRDAAAISVVGNSSGASHDVGDIVAGATDTVLRCTAAVGLEWQKIDAAQISSGAITVGKLATGAVTAGAYGADSITAADIGTMIPVVTARQGGSATAWSTNSTSGNYTSGMNPRMQIGVVRTVGATTVGVSYPTAWTNLPILYLVTQQLAAYSTFTETETTAGFTINTAYPATFDWRWLAIGPEA